MTGRGSGCILRARDVQVNVIRQVSINQHESRFSRRIRRVLCRRAIKNARIGILTFVAVLDQPMEMEQAENTGHDEFSDQDRVKFRLGILAARSIVCHCARSIDIDEHERIETEVCEKVRRESMQTAGHK